MLEFYASNAPLTTIGRPIGNKNAEAKRNGAPKLVSIDASIKKMVSSAMWKTMLDKQNVKIGLEREKVEAAKMESQADKMKAMNEVSNIALAKMT
jgi:hypothetical protein